MPLKSAQGFTKQKYDQKSSRNRTKKNLGALPEQYVKPPGDFEEYFRNLMDQVGSKKSKSGTRTMQLSKSKDHLRSVNQPHHLQSKRSTFQLR